MPRLQRGHRIYPKLGTTSWDGDQLLFATSSQNKLDDIKIDDQGDITPQDTTGYQGLTFYDRGPGGMAMGCHNATGYAFEGVADGWTRGFGKSLTQWLTPCSNPAKGQMPDTINWYGSWVEGYQSSGASLIGEGGVLGMPRPDGLTDGLDTIQGVRTYDSNAGNWTTPDAYAGQNPWILAHHHVGQTVHRNNQNTIRFTPLSSFTRDSLHPY